ncbi:hypothetical protein MIMGU_mgv1a026702mg [Erythranthe guttata]|uniref:Uncharacterized protein n=1 Tax=Erythranthe guttata TaxID=4155 RepID=A0A022RK01_ERYGU|nr:hypothetical protein MIMGU_mgv1a026702mg [Erythranthe guttata]
MAVVLLKIVFFVFSGLWNLITRLVFTGGAHVLVKMIQALKVPGEGSQRVIEQIKSMVKTFLKYSLEFVLKVIGNILSSLFDVFKEGVSSSSTGLANAVSGLVEKSRTSFDDAVKEIPELVNAFSEMVAKIVADLWKNGNDALAFITEHVLN